ncbi:MAG: glycoside hydrolase family 3 C-terminal domain-containing protein [Clostridiales bacterium]|nr:glycoside hydrolase family 3 C-terminal domain-containing protein [Clostridiales bacterium]
MSNYKALVRQMTLEQKASLLSGKNFWQTREIPSLNIPHMALADGPHGLRKQAADGDHLGLVEGVKATCFPTSATMSNSWDIEICEAVGQALGREAAHHEVNIVLGPGLNIKRNPLCGRNFEYYSEDPYLSGKLASAYVKGIQSEGVGACLKHFAANNQEYLRMTNDSVVDERTLHEIYLTGFEIAVKESQPKAVMSSYNRINGIYANEHPYLLRDVLVDRWGFDGIVVSDWGGSNDAVQSAIAGSHLEMPTPGRDSIDFIIKAVKDGTLKETILDQRVEEYLKVLYETHIDKKVDADYIAHHQLARRASENSIVLLKNEDVLPLKAKSKVAIVGDFASTPRYQGAGSSMVNPFKLDSFLNVVGNHDIEMIGFAKGFDRYGKHDKNLINEAVELVKRVDVALVFLGLDEVSEMEGHDRSHMHINANQVEMLKSIHKHAKKTVVVLSCGSAIEMQWSDHCDGIVHGFLSGQAGAGALMNVLTGKTNPSGKLSETYPIEYADCSSSENYPGMERTSEYREGLYIGYRYYDKKQIEVKYPFGYGLSYTTFSYSNLKVSEEGVRFNITNTGEVVGAEIAQMYISKDQMRIHRPVKELKGFKKIILEPGETKEVEIDFDDYSFRYYDVSKHEFLVEDGKYFISVGSSAADILLKGDLNINGVTHTSENQDILIPYYLGDVKNIESHTFEHLLGRSLPESNFDPKAKLGLNDSMLQMQTAKSLLARLVIKILLKLRDRSYHKGKPDLNLFFLSSMPFRAIAKMSDGNFSLEMTEKVLDIVNGSFFKGLSGLIKSFMKHRKRGKHVQ